MKDAAEMGSVAIIYLPSLINTGSSIQKSRGGAIHGQTALRSHKPTFICQNKESRLKMEQEIFTRC
jgi:hypothetical protein